MEFIVLVCLEIWFLWAFMFGGFIRALNGHIIEGTLLLITFLTIFIVPIIYLLFKKVLDKH